MNKVQYIKKRMGIMKKRSQNVVTGMMHGQYGMCFFLFFFLKIKVYLYKVECMRKISMNIDSSQSINHMILNGLLS